MKHLKKLFYNCFFLLIIFSTFSSQGFAQRYIQPFSNIGKITFPSKPKLKIVEPDTSYTVKDQSNNLYSFTLHSYRDNEDFSLDSGSNDLRDLYKGFIKQLTSQPNISLIYKHNLLINGLDGIEIIYAVKSPNLNIGYTCYHRILYVNRTIYNYGFATFNNSDHSNFDKKNEFLNSFLITEKKENLYQYYEVIDDHPAETAFAKLAGKIVFYVIVIVALYFILKELKNFFFG